MTLTHNHAQLTATVAEHIAADAVIQGDYWDPETHKGCFIGCLAHDNNPAAIEATYGIPVMLTRVAEGIFEALPADEAREFFAAFPAAVGHDGKDLSRVSWQFLAQILRELPLQSQVAREATNVVIAGLGELANGQSWPGAWAAARAATAAWAASGAADADAAYAASDAATAAGTWAAARAADAAGRSWSAADAAAAVASAAWAAARAASYADARAYAAARRRQRDLLLDLIREAQ